MKRVTNLGHLAKDENGNLLASSHSILNKWKIYFCQPLNAHGMNNVRHAEIHSAEPLVSEPSSYKLDISTEKVKRYKLRGIIDPILAEFIQAGDNTLRSEIHKLNN
jgi:hypothetical protein